MQNPQVIDSAAPPWACTGRGDPGLVLALNGPLGLCYQQDQPDGPSRLPVGPWGSLPSTSGPARPTGK